MMPGPDSLILLFIASVLGGIVNAVSGGGTLVTFPALLAAGVPAVAANATSTMALTPGVFTSAFGYRHDFGEIPHTRLLAVVSVVGGGIGAAILLASPAATFERLVPYLLLVATVLFALSGPIRNAAAHPRFAAFQSGGARQTASLLVVVFLIAVYGGYFGAGLGLMILAAFALLGFKNIHGMIAMRTLLGALSNLAALAEFILSGVIDWRYAPIMLLGSVLGGYSGAFVARRLDPTLVRRGVVLVGILVTIRYFLASR